MAKEFIFWGIKGYGLHGDSDLLGVVKAENVEQALGIAHMLLPHAKAEKRYRRVDVQFCVEDFTKDGDA